MVLTDDLVGSGGDFGDGDGLLTVENVESGSEGCVQEDNCVGDVPQIDLSNWVGDLAWGAGSLPSG